MLPLYALVFVFCIKPVSQSVSCCWESRSCWVRLQSWKLYCDIFIWTI